MCVCAYVLLACLVPLEASREHWIIRNYRYRWVLTIMWVLGNKLRSFGRSSSALNCWSIFLALFFSFFGASSIFYSMYLSWHQHKQHVLHFMVLKCLCYDPHVFHYFTCRCYPKSCSKETWSFHNREHRVRSDTVSTRGCSKLKCVTNIEWVYYSSWAGRAPKKVAPPCRQVLEGSSLG